jgi:Histidine kinase-, DNA gyrase B-, and HSP90-like ATPase
MKSQVPINFGLNPVNIENAYKQAIEAGLDVEHCVKEIAQNAQDYGSEVHVYLNGNHQKSNQILVTSIVVTDNGCGMHHDTVLERFRGAYQDSESHTTAFQAGRNGVGVKTCFQFFKNIKVETSTKDFIPMQWECNPDNEPMIESSFNSLSSLKHGDPDTELRIYNVSIKDATSEPWQNVPHVQSGTKITLMNPRNEIFVDIKEIIRRLSHSIEFLSNKDNTITLHYRNEKNNPTEVKIKPFYEREKPSYICHAKGDSTQDFYITIPGKQSFLFKKSTDPELKKIEFDIKIVLDAKESPDEKPAEPNQFIISICGANIYDSPREGSGPSTSVNYILNLDKFENQMGFSYKIHGYFKTQDLNLKKALRFNKSALAYNNIHAKRFLDYIVSLFKKLNEIYMDYLNDFIVNQEEDLLAEIAQEFNSIFKEPKFNLSPSTDSQSKNSSECKHAEYECHSCNKKWKVPKLKTPSFCAEHNILDDEGCGSPDIERCQQKSFGCIFKWLPFIGNFVPARFEPKEQTIFLAKFHPLFITTQNGKNKITYLKNTAIQQGIIAVSISQSNSNSDFESSYSKNLKNHFHYKKNNKHNSECIKIWKENNINPSQI